MRLIQLKHFKEASETAKVIFCIESASMVCGTEFNHADDVYKLSGLKPKDYARKKQFFDKLLGLSKQIRISDVCLQLDLPDTIQCDAKRLLDVYASTAKFADDAQSAHNITMAVHQCCKYRKIKTKLRPKLIALSNIDAAKWKRLEEQWDKWIESAEPFQKRISCTVTSNALANASLSNEANEPNKGQQQDAAEAELPYEEWKQKMLAKAMKQLTKLNETSQAENHKPQ